MTRFWPRDWRNEAADYWLCNSFLSLKTDNLQCLHSFATTRVQHVLYLVTLFLYLFCLDICSLYGMHISADSDQNSVESRPRPTFHRVLLQRFARQHSQLSNNKATDTEFVFTAPDNGNYVYNLCVLLPVLPFYKELDKRWCDGFDNMIPCW